MTEARADGRRQRFYWLLRWFSVQWIAAICAVTCLTAPAALACQGEPGTFALAQMKDSKLSAKVGDILANTTAYFGVGFDEVCVSDTLFNGRANVIDRELTLGARFLRFYGAQENGMASIIVLLAHENAHVYQYQSGWLQQQTAKAGTLRCVELFADYLAGGYVGRLIAKRGGQLDEGTVARFFGESHGPSIFYGTSGMNAGMAERHGTASERFFAFSQGVERLAFKPANDRQQAMVEGWAVIRKDLRCG